MSHSWGHENRVHTHSAVSPTVNLIVRMSQRQDVFAVDKLERRRTLSIYMAKEYTKFVIIM